MPFFLAEGSHVTRDVPRALGIAGGRGPERINGRTVYYCEPVGTDDSICQVILELARETGLPFAEHDDAGLWSGFPSAGHSTLIDALETEKILSFGQLLVSHERVWHIDSRDRCSAVRSPADLRNMLRNEPFRPLPTSCDLPGGWHVDLEQPAQAQAVIETVYPGLIADWAAQKRGTLLTESLGDIGTRQSGIFEDIHKLPRNIIERALDTVCGNCILEPSWWLGAKADSGALPCRSACNFFLGTARKYGDACA